MNHKRHQWTWVRLMAVMMVMAFVAQACSAADTATLEINGIELTHAEFLYGPNVGPDPDAVFQDDVVVVPNGAQAIRGVSPDGLYVLVDPKAKGIGDLEVDKVVFLTGRVLGRVIHMEPQGKDLLLALMPVEITELFWEADLQGEMEIDPEDIVYFSTPELPWTVVDVTDESQAADSTEGFMPRAVPISYAPLSQGFEENKDWKPDPAQIWKKTPNALAKGFSALTPTDYAKTGDIGVVFDVYENGTRVTGRLAVHATRPKVSFRISVKWGKLEEARLDVASSMTVKASFRITSEKGLEGNLKKQVIAPFSIDVPFYAGNIPFMFRVTQKLLIDTAMTAKNSFFQGSGEWKVDGNFGFGYSNGTPKADGPRTGQITRDPVTTFSGASLGVSMAVLGHSATFKIGLGWPLLDVGPFVDIITTAGVLRGSDAGQLVCNLAYIDLFTKAGVSLNIHPTIVAIIEKIVQLFTRKSLPTEYRLYESPLVNLIHTGRVRPAIKLCTPDGTTLQS